MLGMHRGCGAGVQGVNRGRGTLRFTGLVVGSGVGGEAARWKRRGVDLALPVVSGLSNGLLGKLLEPQRASASRRGQCDDASLFGSQHIEPSALHKNSTSSLHKRHVVHAASYSDMPSSTFRHTPGSVSCKCVVQ